MSASSKKIWKDETRIGEHAASQPLSGTRVVTQTLVKGYSNMAFNRTEEAKKAS